MMLARLAAAIVGLTVAGSAHGAQPISGRWLTPEGDAIIHLGQCGEVSCGRIAAILKPRPDAPTTDVKNPDAALRKRPILGLPILSGFSDAGKDWRGHIYDPRSGRTFKSIVARAPDGTFKVKGCISFACRTQTWTPAP